MPDSPSTQTNPRCHPPGRRSSQVWAVTLRHAVHVPGTIPPRYTPRVINGLQVPSAARIGVCRCGSPKPSRRAVYRRGSVRSHLIPRKGQGCRTSPPPRLGSSTTGLKHPGPHGHSRDSVGLGSPNRSASQRPPPAVLLPKRQRAASDLLPKGVPPAAAPTAVIRSDFLRLRGKAGRLSRRGSSSP
jgi:hypothetical protein